VTKVDARILHAVAGSEGNLGRSEAFEVIPPFDPAQSYGQTRAALESEFERRYVSWLLERQHGNLSAAAREARMDRKHLHDLAKKHGLRSSKTAVRAL
jgi:DNA-binding NtrC family response regulator